jgi:hypothetical protein
VDPHGHREEREDRPHGEPQPDHVDGQVPEHPTGQADPVPAARSVGRLGAAWGGHAEIIDRDRPVVTCRPQHSTVRRPGRSGRSCR